jgi:predicted ATPase/DNA-binding CsgD family transcriptional regulator
MSRPALDGQVSGRRRPRLLPAEVTSFVGRTAELDAIAALLATARLVTLTGTAGVGKTRLALRAAAAAADRYPDGVRVVELSGVHDPDLLFGAVSAGLGLPDQTAGGQRATVLAHLRDRRLLLILDTCDRHPHACAALAAAVLSAAPGVTLLATSRQPLGAPGEHLLPLAPLPAETDAVQLFEERAAAVIRGFTLSAANRADVQRLCARLDGVPLAIELAAVRLRTLPLPELADAVSAGVGLLNGGGDDHTARPETPLPVVELGTAVGWSHGLCTQPEQALWARLSVFAGSFDAAAAEAVCADAELPAEEIVHALVGLVEKSVVLREDDDSGAGGPGGRELGAGGTRYRLPATLREFGAERLSAEGSQSRFLGRLTERYLEMARYFDEHFLDDDQADRYLALRRDRLNILTALAYALDEADTGSAEGAAARWRRGAELTVRLHGYWQISGGHAEGSRWLDKVLRLFPGPCRERAWALGVRGRLATFAGDTGSAIADIRESIRLADEIGEPLAGARGYFYLNLALAFAGQHAEALRAGERARVRLTACGQRAALICLQPQLAHLHQLSGDVATAIKCCERGAAMLGVSSKERWVSGYLNLICGFALFQLPGREAESADAIRRALAAKHELGDLVGTAYALEALGWLAARDERFERAAGLLGAADELWHRTTSRLGNIAVMEETHLSTVERAKAALGPQRYAAAHRRGAAQPLDAVVRHAVDGADPGPADGVPGGGLLGRASPDLLTRREREVAALVASGLSNKQIATRLFISKRTVDAHVEHIFSKLEISSRVQLTVWMQSQLTA